MGRERDCQTKKRERDYQTKKRERDCQTKKREGGGGREKRAKKDRDAKIALHTFSIAFARSRPYRCWRDPVRSSGRVLCDLKYIGYIVYIKYIGYIVVYDAPTDSTDGLLDPGMIE